MATTLPTAPIDTYHELILYNYAIPSPYRILFAEHEIIATYAQVHVHVVVVLQLSGRYRSQSSTVLDVYVFMT